MENKGGTYRVSLWKPEEKTPLGIYGRRWKDNIEMDF
jgi:hypothetical protein